MPELLFLMRSFAIAISYSKRNIVNQKHSQELNRVKKKQNERFMFAVAFVVVVVEFCRIRLSSQSYACLFFSLPLIHIRALRIHSYVRLLCKLLLSKTIAMVWKSFAISQYNSVGKCECKRIVEKRRYILISSCSIWCFFHVFVFRIGGAQKLFM